MERGTLICWWSCMSSSPAAWPRTAIIIMWPCTIMCDEVLQVYKTFANMSCSLYAFSIRNTQTILRCGLALNTGELLWIFLRRILLITLIFNIRKQKLFTTSTTPLEPRRPSLIPDTQNSLWPTGSTRLVKKCLGKWLQGGKNDFIPEPDPTSKQPPDSGAMCQNYSQLSQTFRLWGWADQKKAAPECS